MPHHKQVLQFKIVLHGIDPPIWRRIQVPAEYTLWDLHVAIQDAMGWQDYHLHMFVFRGHGKTTRIGIPDEEDPADRVLAGWDALVLDHFDELGRTAQYEYDFGDGWTHEVQCEGMLIRQRGVKYPACIGGERACPPEDCGGVGGYADLLAILKNPRHEEYRSMVRWLRGQAKDNYPFDAERFEPSRVRFDNPAVRLRKAFGP